MQPSNTLKTVFLLTSLTALFVLGGRLLGGTGGMVLALGLALAVNVGSYWCSDRVALAMSGARRVSPEEAPQLHRVVERLGGFARLPKPRVYVIESATPNAFATGRDPTHAAVAVTTGLMLMLDRDELAGVLAHELAHVKQRDTLIATVVATVAGAITSFASLAQWTLPFGGLGRSQDDEERGGRLSSLVGGVLMIFLTPIAATIVQLAISRMREYGADEAGARILGDPLPLARALEKLDLANQAGPMTVNPAIAHQFTVRPFAGGGSSRSSAPTRPPSSGWPGCAAWRSSPCEGRPGALPGAAVGADDVTAAAPSCPTSDS